MPLHYKLMQNMNFYSKKHTLFNKAISKKRFPIFVLKSSMYTFPVATPT